MSYAGHGSRRALAGGRSIAIGDSDIDAIFGAIDLVGQGRASPAEARHALEQHLAGKNATMVVDTEPQNSRIYPLGFTITSIAASGGTASLSSQPQILFRPERFVVPSDIAGALTVQNITVGQASQLAAKFPLPARAYSEQGVAVDMHLDTADISQFVQLDLTNNSSHAVSFSALFIGRTVK